MKNPLMVVLERIAAAQEAQAQATQQMSDRLALLIQALAEEESEGPDAQPNTYMDGRPVL